MRKQLIAALGLIIASQACHADIYLMARSKLEGTDLTSVAFLRDSRMDSLAACEAERRAARTTGFEIFRRVHYVTHRGYSAQAQLYCLESPQELTPLGPRSSISYMYLVDIDATRLRLTLFDNLGKCNAIAGSGNQQSATRFCARSQQLLRP